MLGPTAAELLPTGGPIDSGASGPAAHDHGAPGSAPASHEPTAGTPLLRAHGGGLAEAGDLLAAPANSAVEVVVAQLAPILSHRSLAASFSREADPGDPIIQVAYARVWADLSRLMARRTTRRARIRAATSQSRRRRP